MHPTPSQPEVAFLGLGLMGAPMALNLQRAGFPLTVWNRTPTKAVRLVAAGAKLASTPADAARQADVVILMLENGAAVGDVIFEQGVADAVRAGTLIVDMSSIKPAQARAHAARLLVRGLRYIDAPVSGGTTGARDGTLAIMAGGEAADIERVRPVFAAMGRVTHVGPHGRGQLCKLVNQVVVAVTIGAVAEGLLLAEAGGADPARVREAIMGGFCQSRILELHGKRMIDRDFVPGGIVKNQVKDLDAVLEIGEALDLQLPLASRVRALFSDLMADGGELLDHSALFLHLEKLSGRTAAPARFVAG